MNTSNDNNPYSVPGTAIGAANADKIKSNALIITAPIPLDKSLAQLGASILNAADWHVSSITDDYRTTKYRSDPNASYYANGSLSILDRIGKLVFAKNIKEANQAAFKIDQSGGHLFSSMKDTTLGSLSIDTLDGEILNPVSTTIPSTTFSPSTPWIKKLFPVLSSKNLIMITVMELVQAELLRLAAKEGSNNISVTKETRIDMAQIIVDNQDRLPILFNESTV